MSDTNYNYRNEAIKLLNFTEEMICAAKVPAEIRHRMATERRFRSQFRKFSSTKTSINRCEYFDIPTAIAQAYITDYEDLGAIYNVNPSVHKTHSPEKIKSRQQPNQPKPMTLVTEKSTDHLTYAQCISPELVLASIKEPNSKADKVENKSIYHRLDDTNTSNDSAANNANPLNGLENKSPNKKTPPCLVLNAKSRYTPHSLPCSNVGGLCDVNIQYMGQARTEQVKSAMLFGETMTKEKSNRSKTIRHNSSMPKSTFVEESLPLKTNKRPCESSENTPNKAMTLPIFDSNSRFNNNRVYSPFQKLPSSGPVRSRYNNDRTITTKPFNNTYKYDRSLHPPPQYTTNYSGASNTNKKLPKSLKKISDSAKKYQLEEE
ncbi:hypothetical protein SUVZ_12G1910 [Saccharomyces uvarum]|uniref:Uncharacterized protein n=1 Tax=Saccharomyces uvarum TaxID=230603 RepID=A0ABN8WGX6_SACUV|nr:hypothetical protein SUVZ_12G1910 [Saccharomyces uvarum]